MTSQELAKLCGVSKTTVSRVINNDPNVKEKTRQMVLAAMKKYNYVPVASARRLAGIDSRIIGLFIMDLNTPESKTRVSKSSYFSQLTNLIIDKANNNGFQVLVTIITRQDQLEEAKNLFISRTIFSGIVIGAYDQSPEVDSIIDLGHPVVIIDKQCPDKEVNNQSFYINLDNHHGAYLATKHLIKSGHKKIGHITGDLRKYSAIDRLEGYKQALMDGGLPYDDTLVCEGNFQEASGYSQVKELIHKNDVTGIFASNDGMAIGAMKGIHDLGYKIPKDYAVIGFDNIDVGNYTTPTLSTIDGRFDDVAKECISALKYFVQHKTFLKPCVKIKPELLLRESSGS